MNIIKKENITIVVDTYMKEGVEKKVWKTIGELVTMQGNDGPYQFGRMWGPTGATEFKVFDQQDRQQAPQQNAAPQYQQPPQGQQYQQSAAPVDDFGDERIPF
jgi:hypothetical protein